MKTIKKIGILTSGGDAPGMNAAIRAVTRSAVSKGIEVAGFYRGFNGLINSDFVELNLRSVTDIIQRGGTILYSSRCPAFKTTIGMETAKQTCIRENIDGIVVIGGDGSFRGARDLSRLGIPCVAIPGTIDNDIACSEYSIGYDTAVNTAMEMVDKIRDTAQSHDNCNIVEVMGRDSGHIALATGVACGATVILLPEIPFDIEKDVIGRIKFTQKTGKKHFIIVTAEGIEGIEKLKYTIQDEIGIETKHTTLGHVQRGGSPTVHDREMATKLGHYAVELLCKGIGNRVVAVNDTNIIDYDIEAALKITKTIDKELYEISKEVNI